MALTITQTPATCSLAQSPTIFTLAESGDVVLSASFQYYADLYYWSGTTATARAEKRSGSTNTTLNAYPRKSPHDAPSQ